MAPSAAKASTNTTRATQKTTRQGPPLFPRRPFSGIWGMRPCAPGLPPRPRPLVCTGRTAPVRACGAFAAGRT